PADLVRRAALGDADRVGEFGPLALGLGGDAVAQERRELVEARAAVAPVEAVGRLEEEARGRERAALDLGAHRAGERLLQVATMVGRVRLVAHLAQPRDDRLELRDTLLDGVAHPVRQVLGSATERPPELLREPDADEAART